jgi:hypothetical protein
MDEPLTDKLTKLEFFRKLIRNENCDMYEAILNLLEDIGEAYEDANDRDAELRITSYGIERDYEKDIYSMGCHVDSVRLTETIHWEDILKEFWLREKGRAP